MNLAACDGIGARQDGLITRRQSLEVLSPKQLDWLLSTHAWNVVVPTVYRMTGVAFTWERMVRAATLARPPGRLLASAHTACYLWGLLDRRPRQVDVLGKFTESARLPGVNVHRTKAWHEHMASVAGGIPVTRPARAVIDSSYKASKKTLLSMVDRGITSRIFTLDDFVVEFGRTGTQGRPKCSLLFEVLAKRDARFARNTNEKEVSVMEWIRDAGLPLPEAQFRIPIDAHDTYIPDFYYPEQRIAIESQSWRWHGGPTKFEQDTKRALVLEAMDIRVLSVIPKKSHMPIFIKVLTPLLRH